jgi:hypothetical protein
VVTADIAEVGARSDELVLEGDVVIQKEVGFAAFYVPKPTSSEVAVDGCAKSLVE